MPLPSGPGQIVGVDYFGPLPITQNGNKHILLYTDRFSRHIAAYAVTQDERTVEGTARIFVEQYIPLWGCPHTLLSDNGSDFVAPIPCNLQVDENSQNSDNCLPSEKQRRNRTSQSFTGTDAISCY